MPVVSLVCLVNQLVTKYFSKLQIIINLHSRVQKLAAYKSKRTCFYLRNLNYYRDCLNMYVHVDTKIWFM